MAGEIQKLATQLRRNCVLMVKLEEPSKIPEIDKRQVRELLGKAALSFYADTETWYRELYANVGESLKVGRKRSK